jgi:hypothetical protein
MKAICAVGRVDLRCLFPSVKLETEGIKFETDVESEFIDNGIREVCCFSDLVFVKDGKVLCVFRIRVLVDFDVFIEVRHLHVWKRHLRFGSSEIRVNCEQEDQKPHGDTSVDRDFGFAVRKEIFNARFGFLDVIVLHGADAKQQSPIFHNVVNGNLPNLLICGKCIVEIQFKWKTGVEALSIPVFKQLKQHLFVNGL